jgi:hypothetical protein
LAAGAVANGNRLLSTESGQVHSALAYYWDHREEVDADLRCRQALAEEIQAESGDHPLLAKLRAQGQI